MNSLAPHRKPQTAFREKQAIIWQLRLREGAGLTMGDGLLGSPSRFPCHQIAAGRAARLNTLPFSLLNGDVASWHFSDVTAGLRNVCCWGKSGSCDCVNRLPSLTRNGHRVGSIYAVSRWLRGRKVLDCTHRKKRRGAHGRRGLRSCGGCMEARQKAHSIVARNRIPLARPCFARDSDRPVFLAGRAPGRSGVHLFGRTCPVVPCN
jgi:hypothetical protein